MADAEQAVEVDAVVGVAVGDRDGVDGPVRTVREQPGQGAEPEVEHEPEPVVLDQEAGAGAARLRPGRAAAEDGDLHDSAA
jgi:hypothetical protein